MNEERWQSLGYTLDDYKKFANVYKRIFEGNTYSLSTGSNSIRAIKMKPGPNTFVFSGNGTVTIVFYGGRF